MNFRNWAEVALLLGKMVEGVNSRVAGGGGRVCSVLVVGCVRQERNYCRLLLEFYPLAILLLLESWISIAITFNNWINFYLDSVI